MEKRIERRTIREIMTPSPITVRPSMGVDELKHLFETQGVNAFPVVDEHGALRGIVSKLDLLRMFRPERWRWIPELRPVEGDRVADIMSRAIIAVEPEDTVATAVDLMIEYRFPSLPVVEHRQGKPVVVGIVSRTALLRCLTLEPREPAGAGLRISDSD